MSGVWELALAGARFTVTLSPEPSRGFSGEGGVLHALASSTAAEDADFVAALLAYEPRVDVLALAASAALEPERVLTALGVLGAAGRVGFDVAEQAWFHRELPYDANRLAAMHPRLVRAQGLMPSVVVVDDVTARVGDHVVRTDGFHESCTCPWYGRYGAGRGPCAHVLAVRLARTTSPG